jgi:predicted nucleotidyltransferase
MELEIKNTLHTIAEEEEVRILYACESGSRAWGFASQDSDYDVRFLYVRPIEAYLHLDTPRDVIERPITDELDVSGWDIIKALRLLRKSNPPLLEWLFSPIIYLEETTIVNELRKLVRQTYSPSALFYHYRHMAEGNYRQYIQDKAEVPLKKYLYVLRPLAALLYLEQRQQVPPTSFLETLANVHLDEVVRTNIHDLVERKMSGGEMGQGAPYAPLNDFIDEHLQKWKQPVNEQRDMATVTRELERVLQRVLVTSI